MTNYRTRRAWQAARFLLCAMLARGPVQTLGASEFSGGRVTGPLLDLFDGGAALFVLALILTFAYPRVAAAIALSASLLSLPLYLYFVIPGPFRQIFKGEYSVPLRANFVLDGWPIAGMPALALAVYFCVCSFSAPSPENDPNSKAEVR